MKKLMVLLLTIVISSTLGLKISYAAINLTVTGYATDLNGTKYSTPQSTYDNYIFFNIDVPKGATLTFTIRSTQFNKGFNAYRYWSIGTNDNTAILSGLKNGTYSIQVGSSTDLKALRIIGFASDEDFFQGISNASYDFPPLSAPTLSGMAGDKKVDLSWSNISGATGYNIYMDGVKLNSSPITTRTYTVTSLTNGTTYNYQVTSINSANTESVKSNTVMLTPIPPPPPAPTGLSGTAGDREALLTWNAVTGAIGYHVYQDGVRLTSSPITTTTYTAIGLNAGTTYKYQVTAVDDYRESVKSSIANVTIPIPPPPPTPTGLSGTAGDREALLTWNAVTGATGYHVYRDGVKITGSPISVTSYTAIGLINGKTYSFEVTAANQDGESVKSNIVYLTPQAVPMPPITPPGFYGVAGNTTATLFWEVVGDATGYNVYQDGVKIPSSPIQTTSCTITGLTNWKIYSYQVSAINDDGESPKTSAALVEPKDPPPPPTPTGLSGTAGDRKVTLNWNAVGGVTGYNVYQNDVKITATPIKTTTHIVTNVMNETEYMYQVTAIDNNGESSKSAAVLLTPTNIPQPPPPVTNLTAKPSDGAIFLTWSTVPEATYYVYRSGIKIAEVTVTNFYESGLINDNQYYYEVSAVNEVGESKRALVYATPIKTVDFSDMVLPLTVTGLLKTAVNFLSLYGQWVLLVLGVIFAPVIYTVAQRLVTYAADRNWWMKKG